MFPTESVTLTSEDNQVALKNSALESATLSENNTYAEGSGLVDDIMNKSASILESDVVNSNEYNENIEEVIDDHAEYNLRKRKNINHKEKIKI